MSLGPMEIIGILLIVLIIFGAGKLPQVGRSLGTAIADFKETVSSKEPDAEETKAEKKTETKDENA